MTTAQLMSTGPERSRPAVLAGAGIVHLLAALLGLAAGLAVALDHSVSLREPVAELGREFPFLLTVGLGVAFVLVGVLVLGWRPLFQRRYAAAVIFVIAAVTVSGVNLGPVDATDLAMVGIVGFWLATLLVERQTIRIPLPLLVVVLLLIACSLASIINGGFGSLFAQRTFVNKCVLLLVLTSLVASKELLAPVLRAMPALAIACAVLAIGGMIVFFVTGFVLTTEDIAEHQFKGTPLGFLPRATALMPTTQSLAHMLLLGLSILLLVPLRPVLRIIGAIVICIAIGCTFSTGAYVTMAVVLLVWPFLRWPERSIHLIVAMAAVAGVAYFSGAIQWIYDTVVIPLGGKGALDRVGYMQAGIETIREHPIFGIGLKRIGGALSTPVHNGYIQLTAELGVLAGVLFLGLIVSTLLAAGHSAFRRTSGWRQAGMKGLFLGMIALAVHLMFEPFYDNYLSWAFVGIVAGAVAGLPRGEQAVRRMKSNGVGPIASSGVRGAR